MSIENRYEFLYYVAYTDCNPNGDPDMGNAPRIDPETMQGYITDVSAKRRIRNYVELAHGGEDGMGIIVRQSSNINAAIGRAKVAAGVEDNAKTKEAIYKGRQKACQLYYDVRTFGAVMSTGPNAGQVRGPVQFSFGRSLDPILPLDVSITRMAVAEGDTLAEAESIELEKDEDKLRTMGRKQFIPFGLYEFRGFISANLAAETGFDEADLKILFEAILNMYENDHSSSKGQVSVVSPLIIFRHDGTDSDPVQRKKQAKLGCAPSHRLFELVEVKKKDGVRFPRSYRDYEARIAMDKIPAGVSVGFQSNPFEEICWNSLPDTDWLK